MTKEEALMMVKVGRKLAVGEFRDWEMRKLAAKDGKSDLEISVSYVLCGREVVQVESFAERGKRASRPDVAVGGRVWILCDDWRRTDWGTRCRGVIEPVTGAF